VNLNHDYLDFTISDPTFFQDIRLPRNTILSPNMSNRILEGIEQIHKESNSNRLGSEHMISSIMETLFVSISRKIHNFSFTAAEYEATLLRKFEKIRLEMYHQPGRFKVKTMAESMDFSQSHFTHLYRKFFHITPMKDLTKARVHFIQQCDLDDHTSYELTQLLGFESVEYFYRWFKAHFNTTIQQYRTSLERIPDDDQTA
jgi:AraC-like DNA-binding protein